MVFFSSPFCRSTLVQVAASPLRASVWLPEVWRFIPADSHFPFSVPMADNKLGPPPSSYYAFSPYFLRNLCKSLFFTTFSPFLLLLSSVFSVSFSLFFFHRIDSSSFLYFGFSLPLFSGHLSVPATIFP